MLDPTLGGDALVAAFQTIPALMTVMGGDLTRIYAFHYLYGVNPPLRVAIAEMLSPSLMIAWKRSGQGRLNQMSVWEHEYEVYFRVGNLAGQDQPVGPEAFWTIMMNSPVNGGTLNIRKIAVLPQFYPMTNSPTVQHRTDENGLDYFCGPLVFSEIGDN